MGRYDDKGSFRVVFTDTRDMNNHFAMNRGTPEEQKPILVSFRGRARYDSDGTRWRAEYDSMMPSSRLDPAWPDRWSTGFDGVRHYRQVSRKADSILGESSPYARQWTPRSLIWERSEELVRMLEETDRNRNLDRDRATGGRRHEVLRRREQERGWPAGRRDHHLPEARLPADRAEMDLSRQDLFLPSTCKASMKSSPASGHPNASRTSRSTVRDDGASRFDMRRRIQVVEYRPGQVPPAAAFRLEIPYGVDVTDRRQALLTTMTPGGRRSGRCSGRSSAGRRPTSRRWRPSAADSERKLDGQPAPRSTSRAG